MGDLLLVNGPWIDDPERYGVKAGARWPSVRFKAKTLQYYPFPYFMAYSAALLKREGFDVRAFDAIAEGRSTAETWQAIAESGARAVLLETCTPSIAHDMAVANRIKEELGLPVLLAGPHATGLPRETLAACQADAILLGEYEETLLEALPKLLAGEDLSGVLGLATRNGAGEIVVNKRRPLNPDLDFLPFPERDDIPLTKYTDPTCKKYPNAVVITSRGCPFKCTFCVEPYLYYDHPNIRFRKVSLVCDEIEMLLTDYGMQEIYFDDTSLVVNEKHTVALCEEMLRRNLNIYWSCMGDAKVSRETLALMKRAGCRGMKFGLESSSPEVLKATKKPLKVQRAIQFVADCKELGIYTHGTFIFGLPEDTVERMEDTLAFALKLGVTSAQFAAAVPLPGTPFFDQAKEQGWLRTERWSDYEGAESPVMEYPHLSREQVKAMLDKAKRAKMLNLFRRPEVVWQYLVKIQQTHGTVGMVRDLAKKSVFVLQGALGRG